MITDDQLKAAQLQYVRASAIIANTIQSLEMELEKMKSKNIPQDFIDAKDLQIQNIVNYYNQVEDLIQFYKLVTLNLKIQLQEACAYIVKTSNDDQIKQEALMKYLNLQLPHNHYGQNSQT